jgi:hypothetical protein
MNTSNSALPKNQRYVTALRSQLASLRARYDCDAVAPSMYGVIVDLEIEIAWIEHRQVRP